MRNAIFRDKNGVLVRVQRTASGYLITYPDGRTLTISSRGPGIRIRA